MSDPAQIITDELQEIGLAQNDAEVQEQSEIDHQSAAVQHEHQQLSVTARLDNETLSPGDNQLQVAQPGNNQNVLCNISGTAVLGDQHQHITVQQGPQNIVNYTAENITLVQNIVHQGVSPQQCTLPRLCEQQPSVAAAQLDNTSLVEVIPEVVETVPKTLFQETSQLPCQPEPPMHTVAARRKTKDSYNDKTESATRKHVSATHLVNQEQEQCIPELANELKKRLHTHYDEVVLPDSTDSPVPLQVTGYAVDDEDFVTKDRDGDLGTKGMIKVMTSNIRASPDFTYRPHRKPPRELSFEFVHQNGLYNIAPGDYIVTELHLMSQQAATIHADEKKMTETKKRAYVQEEGNKVAVVGSAGIGKTTFGKQMVKGVYKGSCGIIPYVFYVPFKSIDPTEVMSVLQCLVKPSLSSWHHTPDDDNALLAEINESENVYIVTEALDEIDVQILRKQAPKMSLYDRKTRDVIIKNLFSGHILPKAKKLILSRPGAFLDLDPAYKPKFVVKILGVGMKSQHMLCRQLCTNNGEYEQVQRKLHANQNLAVLCYNPMYCKTIVRHLCNNGEDQLGVISSTNVFASTFDECVRSDHYKGQLGDLSKLTGLALNGMKEGKLVFEVGDLGPLDITCLEMFLELVVHGKKNLQLKILEGDKRFSFAHLLWQEFFSALHLMFVASVEDFKSSFPLLRADRWESVVKFMFGFLNLSVYKTICAIFPKSCEVHFLTKKNMLQSLLPSKLPDEWSPDSFPLKVCSWALESSDLSIASQVASSLPETISFENYRYIFPVDISYLSYVLHAVQSTSRVINIGSNAFEASFDDHGSGLSLLLDALNSSSHKVEKVLIANTRISENEAEGFSLQMNNINCLEFEQCKLTNAVIQTLSDAIEHRFVSLERLNLRKSKLDPFKIKQLSKCVGKVQELYLENCDISGADLEELALKILQRDQPLEWLDLSFNELGSDGLKHLSKCVGKVRVLDLSRCRISGTDLKELATMISRLDHPMKWLDLKNNFIDNEGAEALSSCLHMLDNLWLAGNNIQEDGKQTIRSALANHGVKCHIGGLNVQQNN